MQVEAKPPSVIKPNEYGGKCKMESINSHIPKKSKHVGFGDKQCTRCKKHGGPHESHNTPDCRKLNPNSTPIKRNGGAGSTRKNENAEKLFKSERV